MEGFIKLIIIEFNSNISKYYCVYSFLFFNSIKII